MKYILLTEKTWHDRLFDNLKTRENEEWLRIKNKSEFTVELLDEWNPDRIFIPHWSHIIAPEIFDNYECIVFHMTDLPYGRGGSPLQNLIVYGNKTTKVSAIQVEQGIDTGKVYLKHALSLHGTAQEIFLRSTDVIHHMILEILELDPSPKAQKGDPFIFHRRKPKDGDLSKIEDVEQMYDFIRMLDCEGYPSAFLETAHFRFEFNRASIKADNSILSDVRIIKK